MSEQVTIIIVSAVVAAIATPFGAWINSKMLHQKYSVELDKLRSEVEKTLSSVKGSELDNVRKASDILMDNIVKPLKAEISSLRKDVDKFRKAVEKITSCPMADTCPVTRELFSSDVSGATSAKHDKEGCK